MSDEGGVQGGSALQVEREGLTVMHGVWRHIADAAVRMNRVVPLEELAAVSTGVLDRTEARREVGSVLQGFKLCFGERIVIRDVWTAVSFSDVEINQQSGDGFGAHAGTAVGMQGQRARVDVLLCNGIGDELLRQFRRFACSDHPADDIAAEDIEDDKEVEVAPFDRALQWSERPDVVELFSGLSAPNRTCTFPRIRLSISSVAHSKDEISVTRFEDIGLLIAQDVRIASRQPPFELTLPARH